MHTVQLLGLSIIYQKSVDVLSELRLHLKTDNTSWLIATPNPEQIMVSRQDEGFLENLKQMDWLMPDGVGLVWASHVLNKQDEQIEERITGLDLVPKLIELAQEIKRPVLIVGGRNYEGKTIDLNDWEGSTDRQEKLAIKEDKSINKQQKRDELSGENIESDLKVEIRSSDSIKVGDLDKRKIQKEFGVWWCQGYENVGAPTGEEEKRLDEVIARLEPAVIFVALGAPHQEKWLISRRALLSAHHVRVGLTVGGAFDVLTGQLPRAPQSWQNLGLEWLWRLIQEPHRWRRQLALIKFVELVLRTKIIS